MKRILILANFDLGLYKFRKELIQELLDEGNEVFISLPDGELVRNLEKMGCHFIETPVDRRGINPKTDFKLLFSYYKIIKKIQPDMVITYTIKPNIYGGIVCRVLKVPYAVNITGLGTAFQNDGMLKRLVTFLYKSALKKAKVVFFENSENRQIFIDEKIVKEARTCALNGAGVNLEEYPFCEYPQRETGGVSEKSAGETVRFLFIGRVMREKGVGELFEAAKRLKKEYKNVYFDVVGPMEDDYKETIQKLVEKKIIEYHGYQEDVKPFIRNCSCFVLPSYHEGMANTLLEAAAMGRPLITSRIHGCMEAVEENQNGYLCKVKDAEVLYSSLKKFIELDYPEKEQMGKKSRAIVEKKFDKKKIVEKTIKEL